MPLEKIKKLLSQLVQEPTVHIEHNQVATDNILEFLSKQLSELDFSVIKRMKTSDTSETLYATRIQAADYPTVLLYSHYDVQPVGDLSLWQSDPFVLAEKNGRYYGRGSADCKGNIVAHLLALQEVAADLPLNLKIVLEGSEEAGGAGLAGLIDSHPELFQAEVMLIVDAGNISPGVPTLTTTLRGAADLKITITTMENSVHSGQFGGAAPDALAALIKILGSLTDENGNTQITDFPEVTPWQGFVYSDEQFMKDIRVLPGVQRVGSYSVSEQIWTRPAATVTGMQVPPLGSPAAVANSATANINLRIPPGIEPAVAMQALKDHLLKQNIWGYPLELVEGKANPGFSTDSTGKAFQLLAKVMTKVYGTKCQSAGMGGSIPLCTQLQSNFPQAEILLYGVEDPQCNIHGPNESVDPLEIAKIAKVESEFLTNLVN